MKKYIAELIGTFGLVFCGTGAVIINELYSGSVSHVGVAITFGLIVTAMIYSFGEISGAHINPAVTIAFLLTGEIDKKEILPYIIFQVAGAFFASITLKLVFPQSMNLGGTFPAGAPIQSFVLEIVLTYILMTVIYRTSNNPKVSNFAGLTIGFVVLIEAMFAGPVSGASMNPARSLAPAVISGKHISSLWIYITAPLIGSALASFTQLFFRKEIFKADLEKSSI